MSNAESNNDIDNNSQQITLVINDVDYIFNIEREQYNTYVNSITPMNKITPSHNFLMNTVDSSCEKQLLELIKATPGCEVNIVAGLIQDYVPDLTIVVKKPKK